MRPKPGTAIFKVLTQKNNRKDTGMGQIKDSKDSRKGKHLQWEDRLKIEAYTEGGLSAKDIALLLGRSRRTIERELKRGEVEHRQSDWRMKTVYNAERAHDEHKLYASVKGPEMKIDKNREMEQYIRKRIRKMDSPAVIAERMKKKGMAERVCAKTIYNYIDKREIAGISNDDLWEKTLRSNGKHKKVRIVKTHPRRNSIEKRPEEVWGRNEFGHWEIDLIVGSQAGSKAVLLTLVERKTRKLVMRKLPDRTQDSVIRALNAIERKLGALQFRRIFKSITADNGSEFLDVERMERSCLSRKKRLAMYYAHPYASYERGTNENTNRIIRRFIAKGTDIARIPCSKVAWIENWLNNYPRKIIGFKTAEEFFNMEIAA